MTHLFKFIGTFRMDVAEHVILRFIRDSSADNDTSVVIAKRGDAFEVCNSETRRNTNHTWLALANADALREYVDTLLVGAMHDTDIECQIKAFVYEIPGFVAVIIGLKKMYGYSDEYEIFCTAMKLWLESELK